jgi:hypothetical protein
MIADLDNLNVRERMLLAENSGGRSVLNAAGTRCMRFPTAA